MNPRKARPLIDDLISCFCLVLIGLSGAPFIPDWLLSFKLPLILALCAAAFWLEWKRRRLPEADKQDMKRGEQDERNLMILDRACWLSSQIEDWALLALFVLCGACLHNRVLAYAFYWVLIARKFLFFAARWWLNRKY